MMMMDPGNDSSSRFEKSLGLLTTKFVTLLQEADGGILDLKIVSQISVPAKSPFQIFQIYYRNVDCFIRNPCFMV